jgi:hypothetical protein
MGDVRWEEFVGTFVNAIAFHSAGMAKVFSALKGLELPTESIPNMIHSMLSHFSTVMSQQGQIGLSSAYPNNIWT